MNDDNPPPPRACATCFFWVPVENSMSGQGHCDRTHKLTHWDDACRNWDKERGDDSYGVD